MLTNTQTPKNGGEHQTKGARAPWKRRDAQFKLVRGDICAVGE